MLQALAIIARNQIARMTTVAIFAYGVTAASTFPYQSLFAVKELGMSDGTYSLFMFAAAVVGVICAVALGAISDGLSNSKPLILWLAAAGVAGYGLIYWSASLTVFVVLMLTLVPLTRSVFTLLFSSVRRELDGLGGGVAPAVNAVLRAVFATAWVVVPGAVAWWLQDSTTLSPVYLVAALASLVVFIAYAMVQSPKLSAAPASRLSVTATLSLLGTSAVLLRVLLLALANGAHALHSALHPLIMTGPVGGTLRDVGIFAGLLAALEIPFMIGWSYVAQRKSVAFALVAALLIYAAYAALLSFATAPWHLFALAILNSCAAAAILSLPMSYFQDMFPGRPGLGTALVPVMTFAGGTVSSAGFAAGTAIGNYQSAAWVIAAICLCGAAGLTLLERHDRRTVGLK